MFRKIGSALLDLMGISSADAAIPATASLTVNTTNPQPGTSVVFSATLTGQDIQTVVLSDGGSYQEGDDTPPYEWTFNLAKGASSQKTFKVVAIIDGQAIESNSVTVTVKPDLSALQQLTFEPGGPVTLLPGSTEQLRLLGLFNDGYKRDLTQAAMDTYYSENIVDGVQVTAGDSPVFSVSAEGKVLAEQPGTAEVVATNNNVTTARTINVVAFGDDADLNNVNKPPVANAGPDQTVRQSSLVTLNGSGSSDPDNGPSPLSYAWTKTAGPAITLTGATTATPTFTPSTAGGYTFSHVVNDGASDSVLDSVIITVPKLGDIDLDGDVDKNDLALITTVLNKPANGPNDLRDLNGDMKIDALDSRKLTLQCTRSRCAVQ